MSMNTAETTLSIGGAAAVVLAFLIKLLAGKIVARWPALSPLVRAVLHALPNLISAVVALFQGKPAEAPMAEPRTVPEQARFLYLAYVETQTRTYRAGELPSWEALNQSEAERWHSVARASLGQPDPARPSKNTGAAVGLAAAFLLFLAACHVLAGCTAQQRAVARTAGSVIALIGQEICAVLDDQSDSKWVALACRAVDKTGDVLSNMSTAELLDASRTTGGPVTIRMVKREDLAEYTADRAADQ